MDLSKLPRLSETDKHAPAPPEPVPPVAEQYKPAPLDYGSADLGVSGYVWLSIILGLIFMMMGGTFARFAFAKLTGQDFHTHAVWQTGPKAGQEVAYFELQGYSAYTDTAVFLFGLAMVLEAGMLVLARRNTPTTQAFVAAATGVTAVMTLFNLLVCILLFQSGVMPFISVLAVGFGGFMTHSEWKILQHMRRTAKA
jgi:hypothetical protein